MSRRPKISNSILDTIGHTPLVRLNAALPGTLRSLPPTDVVFLALHGGQGEDGTIQALLDRELIQRLPDPLDGRVSWLSITPSGRKLLQRSRRRTDEFLAKRVKKLGADDRALLERAAALLETLAEGER